MAKNLPYQVAFTYNGKMDELDSWLNAYVHGDFSYKFDGLSTHPSGARQYKLMLMFEREEDRSTFKEAVRKGKL
ncbi:hypothetical protein JCM17960_28280 [Magnetospira thiophila]